MRKFVESGFSWMLCKRIDSDLAAAGVTLTVAVQDLEGDFFNAQRAQSACSVPRGNAGLLILCAICLGEHEPATLEHKALEGDFALDLASLGVALCDSALARHGHTKRNRLLATLDVPPQFFPAI